MELCILYFYLLNLAATVKGPMGASVTPSTFFTDFPISTPPLCNPSAEGYMEGRGKFHPWILKSVSNICLRAKLIKVKSYPWTLSSGGI